MKELPDDTAVFPELAFPDGLPVFVGPKPGFTGTVAWGANPIICRPTKGHSGTDMRRDYPNSVPVKASGVIGRIFWINCRWIAPLERGAA